MGIKKSLSLQMIPWCFHVMAGSADDAGCEHPHPAAAMVRPAAALCTRLIREDGRVEVYHRKVTAAEVMKEQPMHLVCRSDAFTIGQCIPALAEADQLLPGHAYFLLPLHLFQSVLSFVTLASYFARAAAFSSNGSAQWRIQKFHSVRSHNGRWGHSNGSAPFLLQRLFEVHKTASGKLQIRVRDDFIRRIQEAQQEAAAGEDHGGGRVLCTTAALEKEYRELVMGCRERQWKPRLETITEYSERKKGGKSLSAVGGAAGALDGMIRRRSKKKKLAQQAKMSLPEKLQQQLQKKLQKQKASDLHLAPSGRKNKAAGAKETRSLKREIISSKLD